jgi:hypothetical protein
MDEGNSFTLYFKVLFMKEETSSSQQALQDIRQMMERSSRFISLSGLSGIAAGICALAGAWIGGQIIRNYDGSYDSRGFLSGDDFVRLRLKLLALAAGVFAIALLSAWFFTWRRSRKQSVAIWGLSSKRLFWNMAIPLASGGAFVLGMLYYNDWSYVAPACLVFYGLALVNASKYTLRDIRYLGICEIILGLVNMFFIGEGLYFWAAGFGLLHIIYGAWMWYRYENIREERKTS